MPEKDRTNPLFPVVNDLMLEESVVRTTQLIFINYCQDKPPETGGDGESPHLSLRVYGCGAGKLNGRRTPNNERPLG